MKETVIDIWQARLDHLSLARRCMVKAILIFFKRQILAENEENLLLADDPVIFAFNHNNYLETILVSFYLLFRRNGKKISFVIDWMYGRLPFLAWLFAEIDPIYVYNKKARLAVINRHKKEFSGEKAYEEGLERLRKGQSIGIFPEGTRNDDPLMLKRGRKGVGVMVLNSGAAVVPIGISFPRGSGRGGLTRLGPMILRIGKPLHFPAELAVSRQDAADCTLAPGKRQRRALRLASRITHRVMETLAGLSGKRYPFPAPEALPQPDRPQHTVHQEALCLASKPARSWMSRPEA